MKRKKTEGKTDGLRLSDVTKTEAGQALMLIPWSDLKVDVKGYQKERHKTAVGWAEGKFRDPIIDYEPALLQVLEVSKRADGPYVMDGQGRLYLTELYVTAGELPAKYGLPCKVHYGLTYEKEARIAHDLSKERRLSSAWEQYNFLIEAEDKTALLMRDLTESCGFKLANYTSPSTVACFSKVRKHIKRVGGPETYTASLRFITGSWKGREASTHGDIIMGIASFMERHGEDTEAVKVLARKARRNNPDSILASAKALRGGNSGGSMVPVRKVLESLAGIE